MEGWCQLPERTPSNKESAAGCARAFLKCAEQSRCSLRIVAERAPRPAGRGHAPEFFRSPEGPRPGSEPFIPFVDRGFGRRVSFSGCSVIDARSIVLDD